MSLVMQLPSILDRATAEFNAFRSGEYDLIEVQGQNPENRLVYGENLTFMKHLADSIGMREKIKLIYVDPPFYSGSSYQASIKIESSSVKSIPAIKPLAYDDRWEHGLEDYLVMLCARLMMMRELLADHGSIWVHLDWHVVHYVKILMDQIFGEKNFINEIIWQYKSGGTSKNHFSRKHDTILFYGKSPKPDLHIPVEKSYNREYKPYRFKGVKEFKDELGWYTMVNMKDVWQIDMVGRTSGERTGYATQKPEALLRRILESCTQEGDICADFFCGAGTLAATAQKMNRKWIACDMGPLAIAATEKRLLKDKGSFSLLVQRGLDKKDTGVLDIAVEFPETSFEAGNLLRLTLQKYEPRLDSILLEENCRNAVAQIVERDSLQLIDFWSVDFNFDGQVHRPSVNFIKEKGMIQTVCEKIKADFGLISIRVCDVFGNSYDKVVNLADFGRHPGDDRS